MQFSLEMHQ